MKTETLLGVDNQPRYTTIAEMHCGDIGIIQQVEPIIGGMSNHNDSIIRKTLSIPELIYDISKNTTYLCSHMDPHYKKLKVRLLDLNEKVIIRIISQ